MKKRVAAQKIARLCIPVLAFLIPSGFYFLVLPVLAVAAISRIIGGDFRPFRPQFKEPVIFFPILLYLYLVIQFFFSHHFDEALSSLSEKLPFLLFPLIIGTSAIFDKELSARAQQAFVASICMAMTAAILYAAWDTIASHQATVQIG